MTYVGWDGREYEDSELDSMREDSRRASHRLEPSGEGTVACICGAYEGPDEGEAAFVTWRNHRGTDR